MKYIVFLLLVVFGILFIAKTDGIVGFTGRVGWAERNLGGAGTFTLYKLIGVACLIFGLMLVTGVFERVFGGLLTGLFGGVR